MQPIRWFGAESKVHRIVDSARRFIGHEGADCEVHLDQAEFLMNEIFVATLSNGIFV